MKKFLLPTVISLALSSSYVFAGEQVQEAAVAAPAITAPIPPVMPRQAVNPEMEKYRAAIEKRIVEQQAAMEKRMADQKAIIEKKIEQQQKKHHEMMEKRNAKMQEMQKLMGQSRSSKNPEDYQQMMNKMQELHERMRTAPPAWANRGPAAPPNNWNTYAQPRAYRHNPNAPMSRNSRHADVEQSLQNIEKLLQEVIIILQKK